MTVSETTLQRMIDVVGAKHAIRDTAEMKAYMVEWRDLWPGTSPLVLRPANTEEVSRIMAVAHETGTAIVPQSGNTGLVGGQIPKGDEVLLSLDRMTKIIEVDAADYTITVEGGCILKNVQDAAEAAGRLFPLKIASEGSCRIGGNLSSNAGGLNVLAYGNARDLCLGLEVVLADGRIWNGLKKLRKNNTGYDLKNLFIGAEGTLGIITAAVLKLYPQPLRYDTAFLAVPSPQAAVDLLSLIKSKSGNRVIAFELIAALGVGFAVKHMGVTNPLTSPSPWYVLTELADAPPDLMEQILELAMAQGIVTDGSVAQSEAQRQALWNIRELMSESQKFEGGSIKNDISVPISSVPQFIAEAGPAVEACLPGTRLMTFGHLGDGNLHYNLSQPIGMDKQAFLDRWWDLGHAVNEVVLRLGGSISAEHGIGQLKRDEMQKIKSPVELDMMRAVKAMLDTKEILNPGKVLPAK
ncbi:MAG: FAD-binding oxidoreductase [Alphaproteobacteria bacterium]|nr:FAD-binding oxidoreductase [Alphaproteobacteria bacterium]